MINDLLIGEPFGEHSPLDSGLQNVEDGLERGFCGRLGVLLVCKAVEELIR